jgi:hypothetical protein
MQFSYLVVQMSEDDSTAKLTGNPISLVFIRSRRQFTLVS